MFFSIDGGDGTGKSTQIELFCHWLATRATGGRLPRSGQHAPGRSDPRTAPPPPRPGHRPPQRNAPVHGGPGPTGRRSHSARAWHAGKIVVADRYLLANVVYQGHAGGLDVPTLWEVGRMATGGLMPDLTFVLDMPAGRPPRGSTGPRSDGTARAGVPRPRPRGFPGGGRAAAGPDRGHRRRAADRGGAGRPASGGPAGAA